MAGQLSKKKLKKLQCFTLQKNSNHTQMQIHKICKAKKMQMQLASLLWKSHCKTYSVLIQQPSKQKTGPNLRPPKTFPFLKSLFLKAGLKLSNTHAQWDRFPPTPSHTHQFGSLRPFGGFLLLFSWEGPPALWAPLKRGEIRTVGDDGGVEAPIWQVQRGENAMAHRGERAFGLGHTQHSTFSSGFFRERSGKKIFQKHCEKHGKLN